MLAAAIFHSMWRHHRKARQPLEAIWVTACSTMAWGSGMTTSSTPIRIRPPAMPNTPDRRAVRIIRAERLAASRAVMAAAPVATCREHGRRVCTLQIYDK